MPLSTPSLFPPGPIKFAQFNSRRSVVHSTKGIVACTQPLAAKCGIDILNAGGNAADAAVAVAAGMNMTEPCSTGIGGDMFCLYYNAATSTVHALNGSGRSGSRCTLSQLRSDLGLPAEDNASAPDHQYAKIPMSSVHAVTVPGAAAGWADTVARFGSGRLSLAQVLAPAVALGEEGFPVSELVAHYWGRAEQSIRDASPNFAEMLKADPGSSSGAGGDGYRAPRAGEIMKNPALARTFRTLGEEGKKGFYAGRVAEELVRVVQDLGGHLELDDLSHHLEASSSDADAVEPISLQFRGQGLEAGGGLELWEHPPNGQGIVALMALGIMQELEKQGQIPTFSAAEHNSAAYLHAVIESLRIAFADASWFVTDPDVVRVPTAELLSPAYLAERARLFDPTRASDAGFGHGSPALNSSDTVYFACSDAQGNAISFINSNYGGFGTCIIPKGCGFTLQNRGANFALGPADHPNIYAPRKRPYHTIIPGLVTNLSDGSLHSVFGVMGGFMQPQGHLQTLLGQVIAGLSPQQALDAPRICIGASSETVDMLVSVEEGMPEETIEGLKRLGHKVEVVKGMSRALFGRGQIIRWTVDPVEGTGVWSAGSDQRGDGAAYPL
ncbi:gamma-glutamyltranspeptidase [Cryphonectria parasitica EP155]|uniref:Gamma-glutamyltranspeptidase n=1 Tax=Cryphonectria parasitica (strain ATCC 38755 / EP155) TaxID=660469 RepID=A0A9P4XTR5_CRYP1|nr:gamma-glutamyltranspeptidase [Cryphonectria parasitica EP155]KAF3760783.1 gamma-glutamyltranspeptidase [Cryphonectria parasitica EP155]